MVRWSFTFLDFFAELLGHELTLNKFLVGAVGCDEFVVSTFFHDLSLLEHDDLVSVANGRESMGDDDASLLTLCHECVESLLDLMLAFSVQGASSFIKEDDFRLANESSCDSNALFLSTR